MGILQMLAAHRKPFMPGKADLFKVSHTRRSAPPSYRHILGSSHRRKPKRESEDGKSLHVGLLEPCAQSACAVHCRCGRTEPDCTARIALGRARPTGC